MSDEEAIVMLISALWALVGLVIYQRLFVIRPLRKKLDRIVDAALDRTVTVAVPNADTSGPDAEEFRKLQARMQVLERIAVEKEDTLSRQIEELRDR